MTKFQVKIKRMNSVIKIKKSDYESAALALSLLRKKRIDLAQLMRETQKNYMVGIDRLNQERTSSSREKLAPLESGLDKIKAEWMQLYQQVLDAEKAERQQENVVLQKRSDLEAVEKLETKYQFEFRKEISKQDQKNLDEVAIRRFVEGAKS